MSLLIHALTLQNMGNFFQNVTSVSIFVTVNMIFLYETGSIHQYSKCLVSTVDTDGLVL